MSDFLAQVRATLDTSGVPGEIDSKINGLPVHLRNITIDEGKLRSQVENALKGSFRINIDPVVGKGGSGTRNNFSQAIRGQMTDVLKGTAQGLNLALSQEFANQGFDAKTTKLLADNLTKSLNGAIDVSVKGIETQVKNGRLHKVVSRVVDAANPNRLITQTATFGGKKGPVFVTQISEQYKDAATSVKKSTADIASSIREKIDTRSVESAISKVSAQWRQYGSAAKEGSLELENYSKLIKLSKEFSDINILSSWSDEELINKWKEYGKLLSTAKNDLSIFKDAGSFFVDPTKSHALDSKMETWMKKNTKAAKEYGEEIRELQRELKTLDLTDEQYNQINDRFKNIDYDAAAKGLKGNTIWDQIKRAGTQMLGFISVYDVINTSIEGFKKMYQSVYEIDTAMTNLKKVTNETDQTYADFLDRSAVSAQKLGRTVSSLVEQTATWSKLGYSLPEAEKLSELSSIYANVAEVDDDTAVSDIVTALKAYGLETAEASRVVDSLNELGNRFATDAASLGTGLSNSASAMNLAGADLYETLAMITGITEITQDASGAGNAIKISSMRIRGMKGQLEELGEEVDSSVDSISKVQTQILNLTSGKVNIFDNAGEFRNYYDIMRDIADVYDELSSTDQATLSEILFGKNRGNQGAALIQAFQSGQIEKAYEAAIGSTGSAAREQEAWMESLEAKTQQFQAAWQSLSQTVLNTDFLKGAVDAGTELLNIFEGIVETLTIPGTLAAGGGIFAFFKNIG